MTETTPVAQKLREFATYSGPREVMLSTADILDEAAAALRQLVAWEAPVETLAPELGGLLRAMYSASAVLAKLDGKSP
jgi:hypothetical protein